VKDAGKLSLELYDRILDEVGDWLFQCQIFGQGKAMLDWNLTRQIIERSHRRRIFTLVSTNCTLITPRIAEEVVSCGLDHLVFAIDGITQQSYEVYRTGGKLDDAMDGMRRVVDQKRKQKSKIELEWQFLVHKHNAHEIDAARTLARELGVFLRLAPLRGMEWDKDLEKFWLAGNIPIAARSVSAGMTMQDIPCYFLWRSLVLNSNGKIARCLIYHNVSQYVNLHDHSVLEAYNHPSMQRARQLFSKQAVPAGDFPSPSGDCPYFERHHGGQNRKQRTPLQLATV
jgi:MoaA/NifB/PqqE/SkfB family radical SAM enzyme